MSMNLQLVVHGGGTYMGFVVDPTTQAITDSYTYDNDALQAAITALRQAMAARFSQPNYNREYLVGVRGQPVFMIAVTGVTSGSVDAAAELRLIRAETSGVTTLASLSITTTLATAADGNTVLDYQIAGAMGDDCWVAIADAASPYSAGLKIHHLNTSGDADSAFVDFPYAFATRAGAADVGGVAHLVPGTYTEDGSLIDGYVLAESGGVWTSIGHGAGSTPDDSYHVAVAAAAVAAASITADAIGVIANEGGYAAEGQDSRGSWSFTFPTLKNLGTSTSYNLTSAFATALNGAYPYLDGNPLFSVNTDAPVLGFWSGVVGCDITDPQATTTTTPTTGTGSSGGGQVN